MHLLPSFHATCIIASDLHSQVFGNMNDSAVEETFLSGKWKFPRFSLSDRPFCVFIARSVNKTLNLMVVWDNLFWQNKLVCIKKDNKLCQLSKCHSWKMFGCNRERWQSCTFWGLFFICVLLPEPTTFQRTRNRWHTVTCKVKIKLFILILIFKFYFLANSPELRLTEWLIR